MGNKAKALSCAALLATLTVGTAVADDVYLTNGEVFEGVIAEVSPSQVRIHLPIGQMNLPRSQVLRVEEAETKLEVFRRRRAALVDSGSTSGEEWLDLARWARLNDLHREHREVALKTAELDPRMEGLAPIMHALGFTLDEDEGRWVTRSQYNRSRGLVFYEGEWMTEEERSDQVQERRAERVERLALAQVEARLSAQDHRAQPEDDSSTAQALETLAQAQVELMQGVLAAVSPGSFVLPGFLGSATLFHAGFHGSAGPSHFFPQHPGTSGLSFTNWDLLANRQPGSLIPVNHPHHKPRY